MTDHDQAPSQRIQPCEVIDHDCAICGVQSLCRHRDLDFRSAGYVCGDCAQATINAEDCLKDNNFAAPIDRALDQL
jgi:hypothetical protein